MEHSHTQQEAGSGFHHLPVLAREVCEAFAPLHGGVVVDCTLGGGGHAELLLERGHRVIGIDQDPAALGHASARLERFGRSFQAVRANFGELPGVLSGLGFLAVDGILMDLGVSSHQLDTAGRGFSFRAEGPLDMRMDPGSPVRASDLVNTASASQLERMFREYGEEPQARRIAARLVKERAVRPLETTLDLAEAVEAVVPRRGRIHPATQVFQALRIAVNRELEVLERVLEGASALLAPGGRMAVITFHSLEDRLVKQAFQRCSQPQLDRPEWPAPRANPDWVFNKVTGRPLRADAAEQERNPRSRSAKLRVVERRIGALRKMESAPDGAGDPPGT